MNAMEKEAIKRLEFLVSHGVDSKILKSYKSSRLKYYTENKYIKGYDGKGTIKYPHDRKNSGNASAITLTYMKQFTDTFGANPKWIEMVDDFEVNTGNLVYHIVYKTTKNLEKLVLFLVDGSKYANHKEDERNFKQRYAMAYEFNLTLPEYSHYTTVRYKIDCGGIVLE